MINTNWKKEFDKRFLSFTDPDIVDGFAKDKIIDFIQSLLDKRDEELLRDMKNKMQGWHGHGINMIEDYEKKYLTKMKDNK